MKWKGDADVEPVDVEFLRDAFAAFLVQARGLTTVGDRLVHPETGEPVDHLRVDSGIHARPGVVYASISSVPSPRGAAASPPMLSIEGETLPIDDAAAQAHLEALDPIGTMSETLISLEEDNEQLLRLSGVEQQTAWHVEVERPARARNVTGGGRVQTGPGRWLGGEVTFDVAAHVDRMCTLGHESVDIGDISVEHRRFRVTANVAASLVDGRILLAARGAGRGRGVVRPVAAVVMWLFRRRITKILDEGWAGVDDGVTALNAEIDVCGTSDDLAREMLLSMFESSPDTPPGK